MVQCGHSVSHLKMGVTESNENMTEPMRGMTKEVHPSAGAFRHWKGGFRQPALLFVRKCGHWSINQSDDNGLQKSADLGIDRDRDFFIVQVVIWNGCTGCGVGIFVGHYRHPDGWIDLRALPCKDLVYG